MMILSKPLRRQLEATIKQAREIAEEAAREAIARMGVAEAEAPAHLSDDNKALRRRLRAHARALGDTRDAGTMTTARLQDATSYEIWHRMLFGRFLAERGLLIHPELGAAMSVAELRDLAKEEGAADEWALAERYAAPGLPGVFKPDDPVLALPIAPEFSKRLRAVLSGLPEEVFTADDSLGWTYQFWRTSEKDAVNAAGGKIGAAELPAVTQLFTEPYMVKFLLHNTLGAWWAGKELARDPDLARDAADEDTLRQACAIPGATWEFLRFVRDDDGKEPWRPAAGAFSEWPTVAAKITYCDPCCGSGHFLVEAFTILAALRQREEELSAANAAIAVLKDNLHGLELDGRCVQIAAFNVALAAWKFAGAAVPLPSPHIAWVGAPPPMLRAEMAALANGDVSLRRALESLHDQFAEAPCLGSLLEIGARDLLDADLRDRGETALSKLSGTEAERAEGAVAARGLLAASALLSRRYVLLATNVPFLGRSKQAGILANFIADRMPEAKADLATAMLQRIITMAGLGGTIGCVTPHNWLFLGRYLDLRTSLLNSTMFDLVAGLGSGAFETISGEIVNPVLAILSKSAPDNFSEMSTLDVSGARDVTSKSCSLVENQIIVSRQFSQIDNPDRRIVFTTLGTGELLQSIANSWQGIKTSDDERFTRKFWETATIERGWTYYLRAPSGKDLYSGRSEILFWEDGYGALTTVCQKGASFRGKSAWGRHGVAVSMMGDLPATIYLGEKFSADVSIIDPKDQSDLNMLWTFCNSTNYLAEVRKIDKALRVTNTAMAKVRLSVRDWQSAAADAYPDGLPEPYSDDPTQWLFHGHPAFAEAGTELHVALALLSAYRWPAATDATMRLSDIAKERIALAAVLPGINRDSLLPLQASGSTLTFATPRTAGQALITRARPGVIRQIATTSGAHLPLADRLRALLASAYGTALTPPHEQALIRAADGRLDKKEARDVTLEGWLADRAFRQHCVLFEQRPFLWQVWDGMKGGFSAFLNYHCLDRATLDKLTYTILGDWIRTAKAEGNTARLERAEQLQQKLSKIIEGESPYDIFVRWNPLAKQPLGWDPDLDDGVRLNIRPFMTAGILRDQPKGIAWNKDRGTDVPSAPWYDLGPRYGGKQGDRLNDHHTTLAEKRAARGTS